METAFIHFTDEKVGAWSGTPISAVWLAMPFLDDFLKLIFVSMWLLYNAVLVSTVQQSGPAICLSIPSLFFGFPFHLDRP